MNRCSHSQLTLLPSEASRLRCRHCHLTIKAEDLKAGYCPECYEREGVKRDDFDKIEAEEKGAVRYRCESCGAIIAAAPQQDPCPPKQA